MATYVYDKLDPTRKQIRICLIHPGAFEDPIKCSLRTVSLDDDPQYETLSYAWGAPVLDHTLLVDGAALKVTKNLHNAFQYLRRQQRSFSEDDHESSGDNAFKPDVTSSWRDPEACQVLWADAVCINQADVDERASQVNLMGDVYQRGIRLHVWIGTAKEIRDDIRRNFPVGAQHGHNLATLEQLAGLRTLLLDAGITASSGADADVMGAIEIFKIFAEDKHWCEAPLFKFRSGAMESEMDGLWQISKLMLLGILTQPWWKRVWVVQEVLLSTPVEATVLHISHHELPLSSCNSFLAYWDKHSRTCCLSSFHVSWGTEQFKKKFLEARDYVNSLEEVLRCHKNEALGMGLAYDVFSSRHAADPHDYIYGFLGLVKDLPSDLKADYRRPISSLYLAATKALFRAEGSMEYLGTAIGVDTDNQHHLPSWCIDWSEREKSGYAPGLFNAARKWSQHLQRLCDDEKSLLIEATAGDRITCVSTVIEKTTIDPVVHVVKWMRAIGHKDDITTVLRVLARDQYTDFAKFSDQRISPEHIYLLQKWKVFISSNKRRREPMSVPVRLREVDLRMRRRQCLFLTRHGRLGAGPPTTREGDCVLVAKGSQYPLALRPLSDSSFEDGQQGLPSYQYVSQCYVDGIMDGEAVDADTEWQTIRLC
ncbi:MAG: hypothetical protein LQ339_006973 [Xanthoria mediterranea]|nr:MAG: hypothetical protein LQ339_006973 [Xanthoria mediterranea]